jgi:hypothetical protein
MALIASNYAPLIADTVLDFLVGPTAYFKAMFQSTLNELLNNKIGREVKADQLQQYLDTLPADVLLSANRHNHIEYDGHGIHRTQSKYCFTTFTLSWNHSKYFGPTKIRVTKDTYDSPWIFTTVRFRELTPEQLENNRAYGITWIPFTLTNGMIMSELIQEMNEANDAYQSRIQF